MSQAGPTPESRLGGRSGLRRIYELFDFCSLLVDFLPVQALRGLGLHLLANVAREQAGVAHDQAAVARARNHAAPERPPARFIDVQS